MSIVGSQYKCSITSISLHINMGICFYQIFYDVTMSILRSLYKCGTTIFLTPYSIRYFLICTVSILNSQYKWSAIILKLYFYISIYFDHIFYDVNVSVLRNHYTCSTTIFNLYINFGICFYQIFYMSLHPF